MKINWPLVLFRHAVAGVLVLVWIAVIFTKQSEIVSVGMTFVMLAALSIIAAQTVLMIEATTGGEPKKKEGLH